MAQTPDEFMRLYEQATQSHNLEATLALIDEEAIYLFSDQSTHAGKQAIEQALRHNFVTIQDETYRISNLTWIARSAEVAVCIYDFAWSGLINGQPASGSGRGTSVLQRHGESWRMIHEHLSRGQFRG
jgi:ketosteroid isomerase-like protein